MALQNNTQIVNTHEAKSRLSELMRAAERGEEVIIARNGQPVVRLTPCAEQPVRRTSGTWAGKVDVRGDMVNPDPEILDMFDALREP